MDRQTADFYARHAPHLSVDYERAGLAGLAELDRVFAAARRILDVGRATAS